MTRLGLIADTHMPGSVKELWPQVFAAFADVDAILHAGDLHTLSIVDKLETLAPTYVAKGNGDRGLTDDRLRDVWELEFEGITVGMVHHFPRPSRRTEEDVHRKMKRYFSERRPQVVVYGHTHRESIDYLGDMLCINPGSPTLPRNQSTRLGTIGILDISEHSLDANIFQITESGIELHTDHYDLA